MFNSPVSARATNVYVRVEGRANQRYPLLFRDYLRAHPATAEAYALVKQRLVAHRFDDAEAYYAVKDPVCHLVMGGCRGVGNGDGMGFGEF